MEMRTEQRNEEEKARKDIDSIIEWRGSISNARKAKHKRKNLRPCPGLKPTELKGMNCIPAQ